MRTKFSILGLHLIFNFGCMVFYGIWVTTKFHFFIRISIEFPIFDMCFPTFREFIILPTKAYCAVEEVKEVNLICNFGPLVF